VQRGSVYEKWLQESLVDAGLTRQEDLLAYVRIDDALPDLRQGHTDLIVLDLLPARLVAGDLAVVGQGLYPQDYAVAVPQGEVTLHKRVDETLAALRDEGRLAALIEEYTGLTPPDQILPATPVPTTEVPPGATPAPQATATPPCVDGMRLVQHLSYDDQNMTAPPVLQPGQAFVKSWLIQNAGTCTWDPSYSLVYVGGNHAASHMGGSLVVIHGQTAPGGTYEASIDLIAPSEPGIYQGFWQMRNQAGQYFGDRLSVGVQIPHPSTPTPQPTATPAAGIDFRVDRTNIQSGECVTFHWNVTNVKAVYFYPEGQPWQSNGVPGIGSRTECPAYTTTYYLRVVKLDDAVETRQYTIHVEQRPDAPQIVQFDLSPSQVQAGQCVSLQWNIQGQIGRVRVLRDSVSLWDGAPVSGSMQDCPPGLGQIGYTLEATGSGGTSRSQRTLNVVSAPPSNPLVGPDWAAVAVRNSLPIPGSPPMTATFRTDGSVVGSGGCNSYSAAYQQSGNLITISPISVGQKACTPELMAQEQAFLSALQSAATFQVSGDQLTIRDGAGGVVLNMVALVATPL
jgi:heat shock protein HslJ